MARKRRKSRRAAAAVLVLALGAALPAVGGEKPTVSAAVSMRDVLEEIWGPEVVLNAAGSGILLRQIIHGAPVDLFLSASPYELDRLEEAGLLLPGTRVTVAANSLVTLFPVEADPPGRFRQLSEARFRRIAIGNPRTVPAGRYAREALETAGLWSLLQDRLVFAESVRQVVEYVARGDVDAGLVYRTDAVRFAGQVIQGPAPPDGSYSPVLYQAAVLAGAASPAQAADLLDRLQAPRGRELFARYGFGVPGPGP